jgi:hypothetical protein
VEAGHLVEDGASAGGQRAARCRRMIARLIGPLIFIAMGVYCVVRRRIPYYDRRPGLKPLNPAGYVTGKDAVRYGIILIAGGIFVGLMSYLRLPRR